MKYVFFIVGIYLLCSCKDSIQSRIDTYYIASEIYIDTNLNLIYQKDTFVYDTTNFFFIPKIKSKNRLYNIEGFDTNCFCQKNLKVSSNKKYCTVECFKPNKQIFLLQKTKSLIIDLETYKVVHTVEGDEDGEWYNNQWYTINKKIGFDGENYNEKDKSIKSIKRELIKTYSIKPNILLGFSDSTNFNVKDSEQTYILFHNPFLVINNQYFNVINGNDHSFLDYDIHISKNHDFIHLNTIDIGYVEDGEENKSLHSRHYCVIIDVVNSKIAAIMEMECDGKWDNDNWIYTKLYKEFPRN